MRSNEDVRGVARTGQRLLFLRANMIVLALALLPAALLHLPMLWIAHRFFGNHPAMLAIGTVPAVALLVFEVYLGAPFLGQRFDAIDVTNESDVVAV